MQSLSGEESDEDWVGPNEMEDSRLRNSLVDSFYHWILLIKTYSDSAKLISHLTCRVYHHIYQSSCLKEKLSKLDIDFDKPPKLIRKNYDDEDGDDWTFAVLWHNFGLADSAYANFHPPRRLWDFELWQVFIEFACTSRPQWLSRRESPGPNSATSGRWRWNRLSWLLLGLHSGGHFDFSADSQQLAVSWERGSHVLACECRKQKDNSGSTQLFNAQGEPRAEQSADHLEAHEKLGIKKLALNRLLLATKIIGSSFQNFKNYGASASQYARPQAWTSFWYFLDSFLSCGIKDWGNSTFADAKAAILDRLREEGKFFRKFYFVPT